MWNRLFFLIAYVSAITGSYAQHIRNYKKTVIPATPDTISYSVHSTNPSLFVIKTRKGTTVPDSLYTVDFIRSKVRIKPAFFQYFPQTDSVEITFRPYPGFITRQYKAFDTTAIYKNSLIGKPKRLTDEITYDKIWGNLDTRGHITRGLTVGTGRDALLKSVMDLQIKGKLSKGVNLSAHIKDTNIPLQENGYSQDLKDLDRVYIELSAPYWKLTAGDIMMRNSASTFLNFQKKISGLSVGIRADSLRIFSSLAKVRGKYTRISFRATEGNQGPYKLKGQNGENYIFIIAGSEKVYINGILQERGENRDYVIDYNTAEITFTPANIITADMRIEVEYQYSQRNYARFITFDKAEYSYKKGHTAWYYYLEQDLKTQPVQADLTPEQISLLANAGNDNGQPVYIEQAVETPYSEGLILYRRTAEGHYEYSTDANETLYAVGFSYFGENQGDYIISSYQAGGRIMQYAGENQGDYRALVPVTPPSRNQMTVLKNTYKPSASSQLYTECALSGNDYNLFADSSAGSYAPAFYTEWKQVLADSTEHPWQWNGALSLQYVHHNFKAPEIIDPIEFQRNWNLADYTGNRIQSSAELSLMRSGNGIDYRFSHLIFTKQYKGTKHELKGQWNGQNWGVLQSLSYLGSTDTEITGNYLRNQTRLQYGKKRFTAQLRYETERKKLSGVFSDSLHPASFGYQELSAGFGSADTTKVFWHGKASVRYTDSVRYNQLRRIAKSYTFSIHNRLITNNKRLLQWQAGYRRLFYGDSLIPTFNAGFTYRENVWRGLLNWHIRYRNFTGNIAKQEYTYIQVEPGQGYYTWNDYNGDGVPQTEEFETARFPDEADYLRIALPNTYYIPTRKAVWNQHLGVNLSSWSNKTGYRKYLSKISANLNITASDDRESIHNPRHWNPLLKGDADLVAKQYHLTGNLDWNKNAGTLRTGYEYSEITQQSVDMFGESGLTGFQHKIYVARYFQKKIIFSAHAVKKNEIRRHDTFVQRNYHLVSLRIIPAWEYIFSREKHLKISYSYISMKNLSGAGESNTGHIVSLQFSGKKKKSAGWDVRFKMQNNIFRGEPSSAVGYVMLEGLQKGKNFVWDVSWTGKINSILYLQLLYHGRRSTESDITIHNASVNLRAQF